LLRAYANLANDMPEAGYSAVEIAFIKEEVQHYEKVREEVKLASGDYVDMKMFEPAMRYLLDTYIRAEDSKKLASFEDMPLVDLIAQKGEEALDLLPAGLRNNQNAMAETIENNVRRLIIDEMAVNPAYYEKCQVCSMRSLKNADVRLWPIKPICSASLMWRDKAKQPDRQEHYPRA